MLSDGGWGDFLAWGEGGVGVEGGGGDLDFEVGAVGGEDGAEVEGCGELAVGGGDVGELDGGADLGSAGRGGEEAEADVDGRGGGEVVGGEVCLVGEGGAEWLCERGDGGEEGGRGGERDEKERRAGGRVRVTGHGVAPGSEETRYHIDGEWPRLLLWGGKDGVGWGLVGLHGSWMGMRGRVLGRWDEERGGRRVRWGACWLWACWWGCGCGFAGVAGGGECGWGVGAVGGGARVGVGGWVEWGGGCGSR